MPPTQMISWKMELPWSLASSALWATESATAVIGSFGGFPEEESFRRVMFGVGGRVGRAGVSERA